jgi:hypothetical protein
MASAKIAHLQVRLIVSHFNVNLYRDVVTTYSENFKIGIRES